MNQMVIEVRIKKKSITESRDDFIVLRQKERGLLFDNAVNC